MGVDKYKVYNDNDKRNLRLSLIMHFLQYHLKLSKGTTYMILHLSALSFTMYKIYCSKSLLLFMVIMVILHLYVPLRLFINTHSPTSMHRNYFALGKTLFFT